MCVDFVPEIRHTAVADFNCRPSEDLMEDVVCREFFIEESAFLSDTVLLIQLLGASIRMASTEKVKAILSG